MKTFFYAAGMWESLTIPGAWSRGSQLLCRKGNLSVHFKCDASLHRCLLSLGFLFNNLITSPDLIFFPQMSLQRFRPMNIHPLFKNRVPFFSRQVQLSSWLGRCTCLSGWQWEGRGSCSWWGRKRFTALSSLPLNLIFPLQSLLLLLRSLLGWAVAETHLRSP